MKDDVHVEAVERVIDNWIFSGASFQLRIYEHIYRADVLIRPVSIFPNLINLSDKISRFILIPGGLPLTLSIY